MLGECKVAIVARGLVYKQGFRLSGMAKWYDQLVWISGVANLNCHHEGQTEVYKTLEPERLTHY